MLLQILAHTPKWVFALFFGLLWLGSRQLLSGRVALTRITIMPVVMGALAVYGVLSAFGDTPLALAGWALAALASAALVLRRPLPAGTAYHAASRSFQMAGSPVPLMLMMGIFFTKYSVGVLLAMHPELAHQRDVAIGIGTLYGAFSGIFAARSLRLWKLALREDSARFASNIAA